MGIDPSIILQAKAPEIMNPLTIQQQGQTLQGLQMQNQQTQQDLQDKQTMRDIMKNSASIDANGNPNVDYNKAAGQAYQQGLYQPAMDLQKQTAQNNLTNIQNQQKMKQTLIQGVDSNDPASYMAMVQKAKAMNLDGADKLPQQYPGAQVVDQIKFHTLNYEDQMKNNMEQAKIDNQQKDFGIRRDEIHQKSADSSDSKYDKYVQHVEDNAKGWRSDPASMRYDAMISAATTGKTMIDQYRGHEDDMPIQDIHALVSDRLKAISGATPTEKEIEAQMPHTLRTMGAGAISTITGKPVGAGAGDFVKNIDRGFQEMENTAQDGLRYRQQTIASSPRLKPEDRDRIVTMGVPQRAYQQPSKGAPSVSAPHPADDAMLTWAKSNPSAPGAADVLKANGM